MNNNKTNLSMFERLSRLQAPLELPDDIRCMEKFKLSEQMELESILLLENDLIGDRRLLPLSPDQTVAVFGNGHVVTNTGGGGSGGSLGSFRYNFVKGLAAVGASYTKPLTEHYIEKANAGGGTFHDVHGWDTSDKAKWGQPVFSNSGWNHAAPLAVPEIKLDDGLVARSAENAKTAIIFISRTVGTEEMDRGKPQPSDWYLNPSEKTLINQVCDNFSQIVFVINASGSMDLTWLDDHKVLSKSTALIWSYGAGSYYGTAVAKLMYGLANFSARLADTVTRRWEDQFTSRNFGGDQSYAQNGTTKAQGFGQMGQSYAALNGENDPISIYQEYIYSGFRYFDTFTGKQDPDPVRYPFGFGLTYSTFLIENTLITRSATTIRISASVRNRSGFDGRDVLQVYLSAPNDRCLDQPYQKLIAFAKTNTIRAGETMDVSIIFDLKDAASYSEDLAAYVLEDGEYLIRLGQSSRMNRIAGVIRIMNNGEPVVVEQRKNRLTLDEANPLDNWSNQVEFDKIRLNSQTQSGLSIRDHAKDEREINRLPPSCQIDILGDPLRSAFDCTGNSKSFGHIEDKKISQKHIMTLQSVACSEISMDEFVLQMTDEELVALVSGGCGVGVATGYSDDPAIIITTSQSKPNKPNSYVSGAGITRSIQRLGIPSISFCDGSAGIPISREIAGNLKTDPNPAYPRAAGIACMWNHALCYEWGQAVAREMQAVNIDIWLAPSINLHRNALGGRNAEYYSEDPVLTGHLAVQIAQGVAAQGLTVCLKHFVGNDQEQYRRGRHTHASDMDNNNLDAINTISSERALREVSLKPFEMAIRQADIRCVMSAFNKVNGQYCAASKSLLLGILRDEWHFKGFVVTDWGDFDEIPNAASELENGNDLIMSGLHTRYSIPNQIWNGLKGIKDHDGVHTATDRDQHHPLTLHALRRNAGHILYAIINSSNVFDDQIYNNKTINGTDTPYHIRRDLDILTTSLPAAAVGAEYYLEKTNPLIATGDEGTKFYTFYLSDKSKVTGNQLSKMGLVLHGDGRITGKPLPGSEGLYPLTVAVSSEFQTAEKVLNLKIRSLAIKPDILPDARLGLHYQQTVNIVGGVGQPALGLAGNLPDGLNFDPQTGLIEGFPDESAKLKDFKFQLIAVDEAGNQDQLDCSIYVSDTIDVKMEPAGQSVIEVGENIRIPIIPSRKEYADMYDFEVVYGQLPDGLSVGGMIWMGYSISGAAKQEGTYEFGIKISVAHAAADTSVVLPYRLQVKPSSGQKIFLKKDMLPYAQVNQVYNEQITVSGGSGKKLFSLDAAQSSSVLPSGLSINENGLVSAKPMATDSGYYHLAVKVSDESIAKPVILITTLYVGGKLDITPEPGSRLKISAGKPWHITLNANGGFSQEYTWQINTSKSASLPEGLSLVINDDYTATIQGICSDGVRGEYLIVIDIDENFSGSPVGTTVYYQLAVD